MFRIRRVWDTESQANALAVRQVKDLLSKWFPYAPARDLESLPERLERPFQNGFRTILYVAEDVSDRLRGCAILLHDKPRKISRD